MAYTDIDNPELYFQTKLYSGNGSTNAITLDGSENMQPNFVWIKNRPLSGGYAHNLFDSVRGTNKKIVSNDDRAETTETNTLNSFNSNGFTLGNDSGTDEVNKSGTTFVSWNWKAGTSVSGTTTGAGTNKSYTGSVNTTSGISIIRYQGNGTNGHTIPHHLGVTPTVMMVKRLTTSSNWSNYQSDFWVSGGNQYIDLNRSAAAAADSVMWYNTQPTSSVFTVGTNERTNYNNDYFINYLFTPIQGYSKFSSYVGNGNADGTFVYTGFKPAFVMVKRTDGADQWSMSDNKRNGFNPQTPPLYADSSEAENASFYPFDFLSNGFKARSSSSSINTSGGTYIYMAFAENPFVTSTDNGSIPACAR
jgi:phage terminase large subunit-like protein